MFNRGVLLRHAGETDAALEVLDALARSLEGESEQRLRYRVALPLVPLLRSSPYVRRLRSK
jgi:hypothetical protein